MTYKFNKLKVAAIAVLLGFAASCEVTDLSPASIIPESEAFATAERVNGAIVGVYEAAQRGFYLGAVQRGYPFGAAHVQQGDMRGEDMYNDQLFYEITYTNSHGVNTANNNGQWIGLYRMINRLNVVFNGLDNAYAAEVITEDQYNRYRGELYYLRALAHHELLTFFSRPYSDDPSLPGVPYHKVAIDDVARVAEALELGRTTIGEDYASLLEDLDMAEQLLPEAEGANPFRARKGAAIALKTRVKLHMQDWQGVVDEFEKIEGRYSLTDDPSGPFGAGTSAENIFSFGHSAASNATVNGALPQMYGDPQEGGRGLVKISPVIWRADFWHEDDLRRSDIQAGGTMVSINPEQGIYTAKYVDQATSADPAPIMRFAEVLLNAAEAHQRLGNTAEAAELLNLVRDRSLPEGVAQISGDNPELLQAIINERRIEFLAEGLRWKDIHRLAGEGQMDGIPAKAASRSVSSLEFYTGARAINLAHSLPYESPLFIWPIPQPELNNNPTLAREQNPGY
jgi:starch-binding outer membrane protein, SusD/RagB family